MQNWDSAEILSNFVLKAYPENLLKFLDMPGGLRMICKGSKVKLANRFWQSILKCVFSFYSNSANRTHS